MERIAIRPEGAAGHRDRSKRGIDAHGLGLDLSAGNGNGRLSAIRINGGRRTICRFLSDRTALHSKASCGIDINGMPAVHGVSDLSVRHGQPGRRIDKRRMATACSVDHGTAGKGGCAGGIQMERIAHGRSIFQRAALQLEAAAIDLDQSRHPVSCSSIGDPATADAVFNYQACIRRIYKVGIVSARFIAHRDGMAGQVQNQTGFNSCVVRKCRLNSYIGSQPVGAARRQGIVMGPICVAICCSSRDRLGDRRLLL